MISRIVHRRLSWLHVSASPQLIILFLSIFNVPYKKVCSHAHSLPQPERRARRPKPQSRRWSHFSCLVMDKHQVWFSSRTGCQQHRGRSRIRADKITSGLTLSAQLGSSQKLTQSSEISMCKTVIYRPILTPDLSQRLQLVVSWAVSIRNVDSYEELLQELPFLFFAVDSCDF